MEILCGGETRVCSAEVMADMKGFEVEVGEIYSYYGEPIPFIRTSPTTLEIKDLDASMIAFIFEHDDLAKAAKSLATAKEPSSSNFEVHVLQPLEYPALDHYEKLATECGLSRGEVFAALVSKSVE